MNPDDFLNEQPVKKGISPDEFMAMKQPEQEIVPSLVPNLSKVSTPENLRAARVVGTAMLGGAKDVAEMGAQLPINAKKVVSLFAETYKNLTGRELAPDMLSAAAPSADEGFARMGIPTDPAAEAKRLGVPYGGDTAMGRAVEAVSTGARYGTTAALTGMGPGATAATTMLSGAGQAVAGPWGAFAGSLAAAPAAAIRGRPPATPPTTNAILREATAALDEFASIPAAIKPQAFTRFATAVEDEINPYRRTSQLYQAVPLENQDTARPIIEKIRTWATGRDQNGQPIYGFTMSELKSLRDEINQGLKDAPFGSPDARTLVIAKRNLDTFVTQGIRTPDHLHGDVPRAIEAYREGIPLYARGMAAQQMERMSDLARIRSGSYRLPNMDHATKMEFVKAIRNPRTMARLEGSAPGLTDSIEEAALGGNARNLLSYVGRYGPQGVLPGLFLLHEAAKKGTEKVAAVTGGLIAMVSREIASRMAIRDAARTAEFVRRGGPRPPNTMTYRPNALITPMIEMPGESQ